jgi:tRNA (cytidine/uridine-2'-O-)-methyltransferase
MSHKPLSNRTKIGFSPMRIALYQPDIPQNAGTILRMGACLGVPVDIIEPAGFPASDKALRRAGMDYLDQAELTRHASFAAFQTWRRAKSGSRLVLLTTQAPFSYVDFAFDTGDILLLGRESAGVPPDVHAAADARLAIPLRPGMRSLNIALAAAMALGEALRQTGGFPHIAANQPAPALPAPIRQDAPTRPEPIRRDEQ